MTTPLLPTDAARREESATTSEGLTRRMLLAGTSTAAVVQALPRSAAAALRAEQDETAGPAGARSILCEIVVENLDPVAKADIPVSCGVAIAPGLSNDPAARFELRDGERALVAQADNHVMDLRGSLRWFKLSTIVPALGPHEARRFQLLFGGLPQRVAQASTDLRVAQAAVRPISIEELLAEDFDVTVEVSNLRPRINGHGGRYVASAREGLAGAGGPDARTWTRLHGMWRRGAVVSEWALTVRLRDDAGRVHPDLRASFHISAYRSAAGQSIANVRTDVLVENGWVNGEARSRAYFYDARITRGRSPAVVWDWTAPETLGDLTVQNGRPIGSVRRSVGTWADRDNDRGMVIVAGTEETPDGTPVIRALSRVDPTTVRAFMHGAFIDRATRQGGYTVHGIGHPAFTRFKKRIWSDRDPGIAVSVAPSGYRGPPEFAVKDYFIQSQMVQNIRGTLTSSGSTVGLDQTGTRPFSCRDTGDIGDFSRDQGAPGANSDIGIYPSYTLEGFLYFDANGARRVFENADLRQQAPIFYGDAQTWHLLRLDNGVDWGLHGAWSNPVHTAGANYGVMGLIASHWGSMFYIPYLLRGDLADMEGLIAQDLWSWLVTPMSDGGGRFCGSQLNRHALVWEGGEYTDANIGGRERPQNRSIAWAIRAAVQALGAMPDGDDRASTLGWDKPTMRRRWSNVQTSVKRYYVDRNTAPDNNEDTPHRFIKDGPHFLVGYEFEKQWQTNMIISQLAHGNELGVMNSDGIAFLHWYARTPIGMTTSPDVNSDWAIPHDSYWKLLDGRPAKTFADVYRASARQLRRQNAQSNPRAARFPPNSPAGAQIPVVFEPGGTQPTFPEPRNYDWYVGFPVIIGAGSGTIVSVTGPNSCVIRIDRPFGAPGPVSMCPPAPGEGPQRGTQWMPANGAAGGSESDYVFWNYHVLGYLVDLDLAGARDGRQYLERLVRLAPGGTVPIRHSIAPRRG